MTLFLKSGKRFNVTSKDAMDVHEMLPNATYTVKQTCGEYFLEKIETFEISGKLYGDIESTAKRILNTFQDRKSSTGVMLAGEKGSGKTLLAKLISVLAAEQHDFATIVINEPHCGESFNEFMQMIQQPTVILFDEFEKVYEDQEHNESLLTLLDGVYPSKKLFLFTCNKTNSINTNMLNRPGRIFYALDFHGVDEEFIRDYCEGNLEDKSQIPLICRISKVFSSFNFDMLKAMVEEMNRYDENPAQVLKFLNAQPKFCGDQEFRMKLWVKNKKVDLSSCGDNTKWNGNPFNEDISVYHEDGEATFKSRDLVQINGTKREYTMVNKDGHRLVLKSVGGPPARMNFDALLEPQNSKKKRNLFKTNFGGWFKSKKKLEDESESMSLSDASEACPSR